MALEDTDNLDGGPENGDEKSNRTFRLLMVGMGLIGVLGLIVIAAIFISRQGERAQIAAQNAAVEATNAEVARLAAITEVPPTDTPTPVPPTATATLPPTTTPTKPAPTASPITATVELTTTLAGNATALPPASGTITGTQPAAVAAATTVTGTAAQPVTATTLSGISIGITSTTGATGTVAGGETQVPKTGAGDSLGLIVLAAGLVGVFVAARRLRTTQA